ncbi:DUF7535 family protein [Haloplanus halophilus]|uniref:DUF7535 family protein n=1 Tax=Haloplanus halophilus TaxID=2949993 RepID=UPI00204100CC|nr:hypothetical protein [Haloplanus sp. GDY1]
MSDADVEAGGEEGDGTPALDPARTAYRTLGKPFRSRPDAEMDVIGWSVFLGVLILLLPLLPLLILVWLLTRGLDAVTPTRE